MALLQVKKDISLTTYVPDTRKCLTSFVYGVKKMLAQQNRLDAFWIGVLKNRNLGGEILQSQVI